MRAKGVLGVVLSDIFGPFEVNLFGGNKQFISFLEEFSRMKWIYLIKTKCEALEVFKKFIQFSEK